MLDDDTIDILRCPTSGGRVRPADEQTLMTLNARILKGEITTIGGAKVDRPLTAALIRDDGARLYPFHDAIPVMLESEAIPLG